MMSSSDSMPETTNDRSCACDRTQVHTSCLRCRDIVLSCHASKPSVGLIDRSSSIKIYRPVSSTIRAERLHALFHSLPKGPFHLSFTLLLHCRSWSSLFSLRRWTPARLHSTLKLRDSSPGCRLTHTETSPCAGVSIDRPAARDVDHHHTGRSPSSVAASTAVRLRAPIRSIYILSDSRSR